MVTSLTYVMSQFQCILIFCASVITQTNKQTTKKPQGQASMTLGVALDLSNSLYTTQTVSCFSFSDGQTLLHEARQSIAKITQ